MDSPNFLLSPIAQGLVRCEWCRAASSDLSMDSSGQILCVECVKHTPASPGLDDCRELSFGERDSGEAGSVEEGFGGLCLNEEPVVGSKRRAEEPVPQPESGPEKRPAVGQQGDLIAHCLSYVHKPRTIAQMQDDVRKAQLRQQREDLESGERMMKMLEAKRAGV
jgi:hypothetical protein